MTWLALSVLFIQGVGVSSCVFDKVEKFQGGANSLESKYAEDESRCLADCYENKDCITIKYGIHTLMCTSYSAGNKTIVCGRKYVCYTLLRNEVDSMCQRYVDV